MVKKNAVKKKPQRSVSKSVKSSPSTDLKRGSGSVKWYVWVILALLLFAAISQAYKFVVTKNDVALLDKAEEKMRQLDFPGGKEGVIERYCSERSVKFGSPGKPACGVGHRLEVDYRDNLELEDQTTGYLDVLNNQKVTLLERRTDGTNHYYSVGGLSESLDCSLSNVITTDSTDKSLSHVFYLYCQKDFQSKLYPIRD